jgi:hypothetical protein
VQHTQYWNESMYVRHLTPPLEQEVWQVRLIPALMTCSSSLPPSLPPTLPPSLSPSLPPSHPPSLPLSLPPYHPTGIRGVCVIPVSVPVHPLPSTAELDKCSPGILLLLPGSPLRGTAIQPHVILTVDCLQLCQRRLSCSKALQKKETVHFVII